MPLSITKPPITYKSHHSSHKPDQNLSSLPTPGSPRKAQDRMYRHWPFTETNKRIFYCGYLTFTGCKCLDSWYSSSKSDDLYLSGELFCTWWTQDQANALSLGRGGSRWLGTTCRSCHRGLVIIVIIKVLKIIIAIILIAMITIRRVGCLACYQRDRHTLGRHRTDKPSTWSSDLRFCKWNIFQAHNRWMNLRV